MFLQDFLAKIRFLHILARFYTRKLKSKSMDRLWVYNSEEKNWWLRSPIRTSDSTAKIIDKKSVFWDTLVYNLIAQKIHMIVTLSNIRGHFGD